MSTQPASENSSGWVTFAAIMMFAVAFLRIVTAISYFAKSHKVNDLSQGLFSNHVWAWGAWDLAIAAFALFAGISLRGGGQLRTRRRVHLGGSRDRAELPDHWHRALVCDHDDRPGRVRGVRPRLVTTTQSTISGLSRS